MQHRGGSLLCVCFSRELSHDALQTQSSLGHRLHRLTEKRVVLEQLPDASQVREADMKYDAIFVRPSPMPLSIPEPANSVSWNPFHLSPTHKARASLVGRPQPCSPPTFRGECLHLVRSISNAKP